MTYPELLKLARRFEGATLETVTGKRFTVGIYRDCPFFRPESSGYGQTDGRKAIERFVERYNETGSLRPRDYADVTRSASYLIGVLLAAGMNEKPPSTKITQQRRRLLPVARAQGAHSPGVKIKVAT